MRSIEEIIKYFPLNINNLLREAFKQNTTVIEELEEIRIRSGRPIILKLRKVDILIQYNVSQTEILQILEKLCENSIYAYKNQICKGFLTIRGGHRIGITGTAVVENEKVINLKYITSLNFRIAREVLNCSNKIFTGNGTIEDLNWWSEEFGTHREWIYKNSMDMNKMEYDPKYSDVKWDFTKYFKPYKLQTFGSKDCAYKIRGDNGKPMVGQGKMNYLEAKYKEPQNIKTYNFGKYSSGVDSANSDGDILKKTKFKPNEIDFQGDIDPIQTDTTDSKYLFDNEDAIIVDLKKGNPN